MLPNLEEYHRPASINGALRLLSRKAIHTVALAGGTALVPSRNASVRAVVDLSALNLAGIKWQARLTCLGAMTTLQMIVSDPAAHTFANGILAKAARLCAPRNIRNAATIGGTVVSGGPTCDLLIALLALDARVIVRTRRRRLIALDDLLGAPEKLIGAAILTHFFLPIAATSFGAALVRVARTPNDVAIVNAAATIIREGTVCKSVRLAFGGLGCRAIRATYIEFELGERPWDEAWLARVIELYASSLVPYDDFRASSQYRREMAVIVAQRALSQAWACAQGVS